MHSHSGGCHCGAIAVQLETPRKPAEQLLGACQCSFCRKHNIRAFSDPASRVTLTAEQPSAVHLYRFGLGTSDAVLCARCGVYVAMVLGDGGELWCTMNIDILDERQMFSGPVEARDFSAEDRAGRMARRKARWCRLELVNWPEAR